MKYSTRLVIIGVIIAIVGFDREFNFLNDYVVVLLWPFAFGLTARMAYDAYIAGH